MYCRTALIIAVVLLNGNQVRPLSAQDLDQEQLANVFVDGVVTERKKYSFSVLGPEKIHQVKLDAQTTIAVRLIRPEFDFDKQKVTIVIPGSAPDGRSKNNLKVDFQLPEKLYFRGVFDSKSDWEKGRTEDPIGIPSLVLSKVPLAVGVTANDKTELTGEFIPTGKSNVFQTKLEGEPRSIRAQLQTVVVEGFSIMDLEPFASEVFVNGIQQEDGILAKRIEFVPLVKPSEIFEKGKKSCLILGDTVSFNYMAALIKELGDRIKIHHPNTNCQGSDSHRKIHRWVRGFGGPQNKWDVIAFNFGHADVGLTKEQYQSNLRKVIDKLEQTKAKLLWIESTPIPFGFNDDSLESGDTIPESKRFDFEFEEPDAQKTLPGRMRTLNNWAKEVLESHPAIEICPVYDVVKNNASQRYGDWWYGKSLNFKYPQSQPIAREIARTIRKLVGG